MKTQDSLNRTSGSERSLEIFIWIAAILVFIVFLIGSSASANNYQVQNKTHKTKYTPSPTHVLSTDTPLFYNQEAYSLKK